MPIIRVVVVAAAVAVSLASVTAAPALAQHRIVRLGTIAPPLSYPTAINNRNQVVGSSTVAGDASLFHGFLWENGHLTDLGTLPGGFFSDARDINERGQIVGLAFDEVFRPHAVTWVDGRIRELSGPTGADGCGATAINNRGDIVGSCFVAPLTVPVLWRGDTAIVLPAPVGLSTGALDINEGGVVALASFDATTNSQLAYRLEGAALTPLPPAPGYPNSVAVRLNARGDAAGYSYSTGNDGVQEATAWLGNEPIALGFPPGTLESGASDINARGVVAAGGFSLNPGQVGDSPFLWAGGAVRPLPIPPGRVGAQAIVINDRGVTGGVEILPETQETYAVLWVPDSSGSGDAEQ